MKKSQLIQIIKESLNESTKDSVAQKEFKMNYSQLGAKEKEWVDDEIDNIEYKKKKKVVKEGEEKSVDQLMSDLGKAIKTDSDDDKAFLDALGALKSGVLAKIKNKVKKGAQDLKGHLDKKYTEESVNEGLLNSFSDYDTVFEMARHKAIPFAAVGILLVKYGIAKAKELIKGGKEEVMDAIEDSPKEEPSTMPTKQPIKLFKKKDNKVFNQFLNNTNN